MQQILVNEIPHLVDERFSGFTFVKKPSSNIYVTGYAPDLHPDIDAYTIVIQFNNGGTYTYNGVSHDSVLGAISAESIGKYYRSEISGKYTGIKLIGQAVTLIKNGEEHTNKAGN